MVGPFIWFLFNGLGVQKAHTGSWYSRTVYEAHIILNQWAFYITTKNLVDLDMCA